MSPPDRPRALRKRPTGSEIHVVVSLESRLQGEALVALLATQRDFRVHGPSRTSGETAALCASVKPRVLVLGILDPWPRNLSPVAVIRLVSPTTRVLALAPHSKDRCTYLNPRDLPTTNGGRAMRSPASTCLPRAQASGAMGALDGDADPATLFTAVRALARGERFGAAGGAAEADDGLAVLSPQELRVARLVGQGASNKEIAAALAISDLTVKKHVGNILHKLEIHDRLQLGVRVARDPAAFESHGSSD